MTLGTRISALLPRAMRVSRRPRLVRDDVAILRPRRREDCALLARCEDAWIALLGEEQARCPARCSAFTGGGA